MLTQDRKESEKATKIKYLALVSLLFKAPRYSMPYGVTPFSNYKLTQEV